LPWQQRGFGAVAKVCTATGKLSEHSARDFASLAKRFGPADKPLAPLNEPLHARSETFGVSAKASGARPKPLLASNEPFEMKKENVVWMRITRIRRMEIFPYLPFNLRLSA
jgi:hypothetical protein